MTNKLSGRKDIKLFIFAVTSEGHIPIKRIMLKCIWCGDDADWNQLAKGSVHKCCEESKDNSSFLKFKMFMCSFVILYNDQQIRNYFTNYHTATYFDTIVSSSGSL